MAKQLWCNLLYIVITVGELGACEPVKKKPRLDIDRDAAMELSVFTSGKSTTLLQVTMKQQDLHSYLVHLNSSVLSLIVAIRSNRPMLVHNVM